MSGQERLFRAIGSVDVTLLERSEKAAGGRRRTIWIGLGLAAACLALVLLAVPESSPPEPSPPDTTLEYHSVPMRLHCLQLQTEREEAQFSIYVNEESYRTYEESGVYTIVPQAENLPKECKMEIYHLPDITVTEAIEQLCGSLKESYDTVVVRRDYWVTQYSPSSIKASEGTEWDDMQSDVWFAEDGRGGVFVLKSSYFLEATEGHGLRFWDMACTFSVVEEQKPEWFVQLEDATRRLYMAAFTDDWDSAKDLLTEDAEASAYSENVYPSVSIASIDYAAGGIGFEYQDGVENVPDSAAVSVKHRLGGEDSFTYLTMELSRSEGQWRAQWVLLEK